MINLREAFEKHSSEFGRFDLVENKLSKKQDVHALILLDKLLPGITNIINGFDDVYGYYLGIDTFTLSKEASEEDIITLIRCGVKYYPVRDTLYLDH